MYISCLYTGLGARTMGGLEPLEEKKKKCTCVSHPTPTFPVLSARIRLPRSQDRSEQLSVMAIIVLIICEK